MEVFDRVRPKAEWKPMVKFAGLIAAAAALIAVSQATSCHMPYGVGETVRIGGIPVANDGRDPEPMCWDSKTGRPAKCTPFW